MEISQVTEQTIITYYIVDCLLIVYGSIYITFFNKHIYMYYFWYGLYKYSMSDSYIMYYYLQKY